MSLSEDIKQKALEFGFDLVGVTGAGPVDAGQVEFLAGWLKSGGAGQMGYLHRNFEKRINPANLLDGAQSVICSGLNYKPPKQKSMSTNVTAPTGKVASYARYEDYHVFIKRQLRELIDFITSVAGREHKFKICVDSAPLAERALAARAGLGFIGKNHMLINPTLGPQIFLGEIVTTLKLSIDKPIAGDCSNCNKCIAACPTGALGPDGRFDANKCISYLTIEYTGRIPAESAEKIGDRLFGCDECVLACPYQQKAPACKNNQFKFYNDRAEFALQEILEMSEEQFQAGFADSVILRPGLDQLKRNAKICLMNSKK
jgi:epoxyqueuosine reductase